MKDHFTNSLIMEIEEIIENNKYNPLGAKMMEKPETRNMAKSVLHKQSMDFLKILFANGKVQHLRKTLN